MPLPLFNDAEAQVSGTAVAADGSNTGDAASTAFSTSVTGANMTLTFDNTNPMNGVNAYKIALTSTATAITYLEWTAAATAGPFLNLQGTFFFRTTTVPAVSTVRLVQFFNGSTVLCGFGGPGSGSATFGWRSAADASIGSLTSAISANTWYRVEWAATFGGTNGWAIATLYVGTSSTPFSAPAQVNNLAFAAGGCDKIRFGFNTAVGYTTSGNAIFFDDILVSPVTSMDGLLLSRRPLPMIQGPDTDQITRMQGPK